MAAAQMVKRRVFTDGGELLREGMAPKDVPNTRADLMAWWERQDQLDAEAEAAKAEAALVELNAPAAPDPAELIAPLADELATLSPRVAELEALRLATPEAVLEGSMQIARAAGAAALVEGAAQVAIAKVDGVAAAADARLSEIEGSVNETAAAVGQLLADGQQRLDQVSAEMLAKTTNAISKRIAALEVQASQLRGPKGNTGRIGQGLIAGAGPRPELRPDGFEWAPGDSWLNTKTEGFELEFMDAGGQWSRPQRLVPAPKLINATANILDQSTPQTNIISNVWNVSGSGGGGMERLLVGKVNRATVTEIADSSNHTWNSTTKDPRSCQLWLEIIDPTTAESGMCCAAISLGPATGSIRISEYALTGVLFEGAGAPDVDIDGIRLGAPRTPAGLVPAGVPVGTSATVINVRVGANLGAGATSTYLLRGGVEWLFEADGKALNPADAALLPQPAWTWS